MDVGDNECRPQKVAKPPLAPLLLSQAWPEPGAAALLSAVLSLAVYVRTMYPTVSGGDSGELMGVVCSGGVAHPPGYPLYLLLATLWSEALALLPLPSNPAWRMNLMSAVWGAVASGLVVLCTFELPALSTQPLLPGMPGSRVEEAPRVAEVVSGRERGGRGGRRRPCEPPATTQQQHSGPARGETRAADEDEKVLGVGCALAVGLLFALNSSVWEQCLAAEVFSLNNALCAALVLCFLRHERAKAAGQWAVSWRWALAGALVSGLCLSNQHTSVIYVGVLALAVVCGRLDGTPLLLCPGRLLALGVAGLAGLSPYLYLPWASARRSEGSWGDQTTLAGFLTHFLRREYGTFKLASDLGEPQDLSKVLARTWAFTSSFSTDSLGLGPPLAALGLLLCIVRLPTARPVALSLVTYVCFINGLANLPLTPLHLSVLSRMWQQALVLCYVMMGLGLTAAGRALLLLSSSTGRRRRPLLSAWPMLTACLAPAGLQAWRHGAQLDHSGNTAFADYAHDVLRGLPTGSVLLANDDANCNLLLYLRLCEHVRPDVGLVRLPLITYDWWRPRQLHHYPSLAFPGTRHHPYDAAAGSFDLASFLTANLRANLTNRLFVVGEWKTGDPSNAHFDGPPTRLPLGLAHKVRLPHHPAAAVSSPAELLREVRALEPLAGMDQPIPHARPYDQDGGGGGGGGGGHWEAVVQVKYLDYYAALSYYLTNYASNLPPPQGEEEGVRRELLSYVVGLYERYYRLAEAVPGGLLHTDARTWQNGAVMAGQLSLVEDEGAENTRRMWRMLQDFVSAVQRQRDVGRLPHHDDSLTAMVNQAAAVLKAGTNPFKTSAVEEASD